jgi:peptidoglycan lytic transglycosylase
MKRLFIAALALACAALPASAGDNNNFLAGVLSIDVVMHRIETCEASQYGVGDGYNGRRTASGLIFNTHADNPYTVAHRSRPFGSFVTITNLANGRSIRAMVTDRGPFHRGRCVDLGRAGANAIGMGGTARVSVE